MWEMVYADGNMNEFEDNVVWRASDLLGISQRDRVELSPRSGCGQQDAGRCLIGSSRLRAARHERARSRLPSSPVPHPASGSNLREIFARNGHRVVIVARSGDKAGSSGGRDREQAVSRGRWFWRLISNSRMPATASMPRWRKTISNRNLSSTMPASVWWDWPHRSRAANSWR